MSGVRGRGRGRTHVSTDYQTPIKSLNCLKAKRDTVIDVEVPRNRRRTLPKSRKDNARRQLQLVGRNKKASLRHGVSVQGGPSGRGLPFVGIKLKVAL